jgi:hypothetical protein
MRDPFETNENDNSQPADTKLDLSSFKPKVVPLPNRAEMRDIEEISAQNGFRSQQPKQNHQRGKAPPRDPWTVRISDALKKDLQRLGIDLDLRDDDVFQILYSVYQENTPSDPYVYLRRGRGGAAPKS